MPEMREGSSIQGAVEVSPVLPGFLFGAISLHNTKGISTCTPTLSKFAILFPHLIAQQLQGEGHCEEGIPDWICLLQQKSLKGTKPVARQNEKVEVEGKEG